VSILVQDLDVLDLVEDGELDLVVLEDVLDYQVMGLVD
jgi:hypothetical protein